MENIMNPEKLNSLMNLYKECIENDPSYLLTDALDNLTDGEKIIFRDHLQALGFTKLPRNLYYNYTKQYWITCPNFPKQK
jgi:hypothetical protein